MNDKFVLVLAGIVAFLAVIFLGGAYKDKTSKVFLYEVGLGKTGSEVCYERNMSCISMTTTKLFDEDMLFYGFATPDCDSQVVEMASCLEDFDTNYAIDGVDFKKSPNAESPKSLSSSHFCLRAAKGKQGIFEHVYCVKR